MADATPQEPIDDDPHDVSGLIYTALYDTSGEMVEGAFVDRWERNADRAIEEIEEIFARYGFTAADEERLRVVMRDPTSPHNALVVLLHSLRKYTRRLVSELRHDALPAVRALCVRVGASLFEPSYWLGALEDDDAKVRAAAVTTVIEQRRKLADAETLLMRALADSHPNVRRLAGTAVNFYKHPAGTEALLRCLEIERNRGVRKAIVEDIARKVRTARVHEDRDAVTKAIGEPLKALLLADLNNNDGEIRELIALALERLSGVDIATALLDRLLVEQEARVRHVLARFPDYRVIAGRALPILSALLASDPDPVVRMNVAWALQTFGAATIPLLVAALDDVGGAQYAAASVLRAIGTVQALPGLARALSNAANHRIYHDLVGAIRDILLGMERSYRSSPAPEVTAATQARIQARIDALKTDPTLGYPVTYCRDVLNAYPLHSNLIYMWAIQPDGTLLCMDHEAFSHATEPESDPLIHFAVIVKGARRYTELEGLVPLPPKGTQPCLKCNTSGWVDDAKGDSERCPRCDGLGWYRPN